MKNGYVVALLALGAVLAAPGAAQAGLTERTIAALDALAAKGSARAQYELARHYDEGKGVTRDPRRALYLYCKAARQEHGDAAYKAGQMLVRGIKGVAADLELGRAWLRKAATLGNVTAGKMMQVSTGSAAKTPDRCEPPQLRYTPRILATPPAEIRKLVNKMAPTYGLDPDLVLAVIAAESAFQNNAVSPKSAMGLMQLIPETAERFGVSDPFDPTQNLRGGMKYLRWLLAFFEGDVTLALAGYNAGEGAVLQYKGVPPYRETQDYVLKIRTVYARRVHPFDSSVVRSAGLPRAREVVAELSYSASSSKAMAATPPAKPARN